MIVLLVKVMDQERSFNLEKTETYERFQDEIENKIIHFGFFIENVRRIKFCFWLQLQQGNTLLNYYGINSNLIPFCL